MSTLRLILVVLAGMWCSLRSAGQQVFINEIHYDNEGNDAQEGIEIAGPAGTDLSSYSVVFYNGTGGVVYMTRALGGTIPGAAGSFGAVWFTVAGIQNGAPDGMVLRHGASTVVQTIGYEGSFTATGGAAAGMFLGDIGVDEEPAPAAGMSLQLTGSGSEGSDLTWTGPLAASPGQLNAGQTLTGSAAGRSALTFSPLYFAEGTSATLTIQLTPAPSGMVSIALSSNAPGALDLPAAIGVSTSGTASISVTAPADGLARGFRSVTLAASDPGGLWAGAQIDIGIIDVDRPVRVSPGSLRVMTLNVHEGVGEPGSAEFKAVREIVERISPDVLLLQEVGSDANFGSAGILAAQAGFPGDAAYRAVSGDAFAAVPYQRGDIPGGTDINLVAASRFPISRRVQCGRGAVAGRSEISRYPLLTVIDVPWLSASEDPAIVNVHLKAEPDDASCFRRAVEALRLREALAAEGYGVSGAQVIVAGDFNATDFYPQPVSYVSNTPAVTSPGTGVFADGSKLPQSYAAGADLLAGMTLNYATFPHSGMNPAGLTSMVARQAEGQDVRTFALASYKLDYFFVSAAIAARRGPPAEIYNSRLEHAWDGQPKQPSLPEGNLSLVASDHYALFADIPLLTLPVLSASFSAPLINEGGAGLSLTINVTPAPAAPLTVSLATWRDERLTLPETLLLPAGQSSMIIPVGVPSLPGAQALRNVSVLVEAPGTRSTTASVTVRNLESAGQLVMTRYTDPPTSNDPRAIEVMNTAGVPIDFARTPLRIRRYANGDTTGLTDAEATSGMLPAGAVLVIGDDATGDYLVSQGLIPAPATPFRSQTEPVVFLDAAGNAAFLLDSMFYNGDDAMEILLNDYRCDVLGVIGQDPGTAWTGPGTESTADKALTLRPGLLTGSSGWTQPGLRFTAAAPGLTGFGIPPATADAYLVWAAGASLTGLASAPDSDPDGDGAGNLLEYALLTDPRLLGSQPALGISKAPLQLRRSLRTGDPFLSY